MVLPAIMVVGLALVAFLLSPLLRHGMDGGFVEVPVERLGQGPPLPTRNVEVAALPLLDRASRGRPAPTRAWRRPRCGSPGARGHRPRRRRAHPGGAGGPRPARVDLDALAGQRRFRGVVRDVGWAGLSDARRQALEARGNTLAVNVKLVEFRADARADLGLALGILGFLGLLVAATSLVLWRRRRR
ncbi:MAG: hypothetical protein R3F43_28200 [bacterium]